MKKQIKMIGLDCDGTLLNNNKELTEHSREVLLRAIDQGIIVLAATGRPLTGVPEEILKLPGIRYALTSNGARIVDLKKRKVIYEATMPVGTARKILDVFARYDTYKEIFIAGTGYSSSCELDKVEQYVLLESMACYMRACRVPVRDVYEKLEQENKPVDKVHALFRNMEEREKAFREIEEIPGTAPTGAMANNIEVNAYGVNKGVGLIKLGEILGIQREEIMACGDGMNDLEMLREAGVGVAVENAVQAVKDAADYITDTNENEGVAKAIEKIALA